jgi:predicted nucleotidyltransferase
MRDGGSHLNMLQKSTVDLHEYLLEISGISSDTIGVTGSQLVGLSTKGSDIDLVVYGMEAGRKLFNALSDASCLSSALQRYSGDELVHHAKFRWGDQNQMLSTLVDIEQEKVLQGLYDSRDFFIRLVKTPSELGWRYGESVYRNIGIKTVRCCIVDDSDSIFTPCRYVVESKDIPELREIISYRGRYTEHGKNGMWIDVRGRLEEVTEENGEIYKHMVLGENSDDFMLPSKSH